MTRRVFTFASVIIRSPLQVLLPRSGPGMKAMRIQWPGVVCRISYVYVVVVQGVKMAWPGVVSSLGIFLARSGSHVFRRKSHYNISCRSFIISSVHILATAIFPPPVEFASSSASLHCVGKNAIFRLHCCVQAVSIGWIILLVCISFLFISFLFFPFRY